MAISRSKKSEILSKLIENIKNAKSIGFTQTNGMTVSDFFDLRRELKSVNSTYMISKKTLIRIAVKEALNLDLDLSLLPGQIGMVFSNGDPVEGLNKVNSYIEKVYDKKEKIQKISWVASIFDGKINNDRETKIIASIPSRKTLLSKFAGSMMSPLSRMTRFLNAIAREIEAKGKAKAGELKEKEE